MLLKETWIETVNEHKKWVLFWKMFYLIKGPFVHLETRITLSFENSMINITGHFLLQQRRQIRFGCKIGSPAESVISAAAAMLRQQQQQQQQYNKKNPLLVNETREVSIMYLVQTLLIACRSREVHANKSGNKHFYVFSLSPASSSSSKPKRCFKEPCYYLT